MQLWTHCSKILFFFRHSPWRAHFFEIIHALRIKDTKYKVHLEWVKVGVLWEGYIFFCEMTIFFQVLIVMTEDVFFSPEFIVTVQRLWHFPISHTGVHISFHKNFIATVSKLWHFQILQTRVYIYILCTYIFPHDFINHNFVIRVHLSF